MPWITAMSENIELVNSAVARFEEILSDKAASKKFLVWNEFFTDESYSQVVGTEEFIDKVKPIISKPCLSFECAQMLSERFAGAKAVFDEKKKAYFVDFSPEENEAKRRKQKVHRDRPSFPIVSWTWRFMGLFIIMIIVYLVIIAQYQAKRDEVNSQVKISVATTTTTVREYTSEYPEAQRILRSAWGEKLSEKEIPHSELYDLAEGEWTFKASDGETGYLIIGNYRSYLYDAADVVVSGSVDVEYAEKGAKITVFYKIDGEELSLEVSLSEYGSLTGKIELPGGKSVKAVKSLEMTY